MSIDSDLRSTRLPGAIVVAALLLPAGGLLAAEPDERLEVHDLSLWIIDPGNKLANARTAYPSALPVTVNSVRSVQASIPLRRVAPINLLTFHGRAATDLDIDLRTKFGSFLAHWPPGDSLPNRLRWSGAPSYNLVREIDDDTELMFVDDDDWIAKARGGDGLYIKRGARSERFLAYDVELKLEPPVRLEGGPEVFKVINTSGATLYDVLLARRTPEGCRVAWIDVLPAGEAPADAATSEIRREAFDQLSSAEQQPAATHNAVPRNGKLAFVTFDTQQAGGKPAAQPKPKPAGKLFGGLPAAKAKRGLFGGIPAPKPAPGVEVTLSKPLAVDSPATDEQTTEALSQRLTKAGLTARESELFVDHYGSLLFEGEALVVACRLDPATIDEKLPLSIFPMPTATVRVAMVLVRNADPQLAEAVDKLIAQLGDREFAVREAAQERLTQLGPLAFPALNQALNHADLEIVIRAERILLSQKQTPNPKAGAARGAGQPFRRIRAAPVLINR